MTPIATTAQRFINISIEKVIQLHEAGHTTEAIAQFADILSCYPNSDEVIFRLAELYQFDNRAEEAIPLLKRIDAQSPYYADALFHLGTLLGDRRDFAGGANCLIRLLEIDDNRVGCYNRLARFLMELGQPDDAEKYLRKSIQAFPDSPEAHLYLGNLFARYWRLGEAREQYERVIELQANHSGAISNLSGIAVSEGNITEAVALLHTSLKLQPKDRIATDNLLFNMNYSDRYSPEQIRDEHLGRAELYSGSVKEKYFRRHQPGKKIKVGYVSGDFRSHSVSFFIEPVLCHHSRAEFEIFCYDMVPVPDQTTSRIMALGWTWRPIYGISDSAVAEQIRADDIDILVDLSGHTQGNRLGVFGLRPAAHQVTWLGYPNTTGLKQMDFRLTDEWADPTNMTDHLYSEKLVRLPQSFLCYAPPVTAPKVAPLPGKPFTFCCFNHHPKISDTVLGLWVRILRSVPASTLLLKNGPLSDPYVQVLLTERFAAIGIDSSRFHLERFSLTREEHLQQYGACHVALDTYPYNGTTTTCEALWMGVPVITLAGSTHASRVGMSILENSGLPELVAQNADQYVEIAESLAQSPERLMKYRHSLRDQLSRSPLTDADGFTNDLEQIYRQMINQPHV